MIPRSSRSCRLSRRSCASSACSLLVSPGRLPRSISACVTQRRTAVSVRSRSRATSGIDRFPFRHSSTTSALKAGVNALLRRRCCIVCSIGEHPPGAAAPHFGCPPNRGKPIVGKDGVSRDGTHRFLLAAHAWTKQRPFPTRRFCCPLGSISTTAASDSLPACPPLPGSSPVIGSQSSRAPQARSAGEGLSSSRRHLPSVPSPLRRGVPRGCFQVLHPFHGLRPESPGSALPLSAPADPYRRGRL